MRLSWSDCREELVKSLARYVGYTTGAFRLDRIAELTTYFDDRPAVLTLEVVKLIEKKFDVKARYAHGVIDFAVSLGFLKRVAGGGRAGRLVLTDFGRAYRSALGLTLKEYRGYLLTFSLLEFDADVYALLLELALNEPLPKGKQLHALFSERVHCLREERLRWVNEAFPDPRLRERIISKEGRLLVPWLTSEGTKLSALPVEPDFARHHAAPRRGWAIELGHLQPDCFTSHSGRAVLARLRAGGPKYFWLGPTPGCLEKLHVAESPPPAAHAPAWSILRPPPATPVTRDQTYSEICDALAEFMKEAYRFVRLVNTNQAPIHSVLPYLYFRELSSGQRVDKEEILRDLFRRHEERLAPLSARNSLFGHYQLR